MSYYVIADEDTVLGFRYAGVPGEVAENPEQALEAFQRVTSSRKSDVIVLTEDLAASIRVAVNHVRFDLQTPVVVEVPGARGPASGRPDLLKLIQEAIGVKLTT
jgi:vacuolar-type H+-ATPase subunit F/Vma7